MSKTSKANRGQRALAFLLSLSLILTLLLGSAGRVFADDSKSDGGFSDTELSVINGIDTDFITEKVEYVHNNIGARVAGTPADEKSADYFAGVLKDLGYEPFSFATAKDGVDDYFETIDKSSEVKSKIGASVTINGREYPALAPGWSDYSVYKGYEHPSVSGETAYFENPDDAAAADPSEVAGKVVLTFRKAEWSSYSSSYADIARKLEANGAVAVVYFYNKYTISRDGQVSGDSAFRSISYGSDINIPIVLTSYLDGKAILKSLTCHDKVESTTATVVNRRNTHTSNILALKPASQPSDKYVIVGAHRDSVFGAEGVNDNLSGTVNVLAIAKALKNIPTDYNVIFALWAAEEDGLIGSKFFYSDVLYSNNWGKQHVVAYYNMDMAATSQKRNSLLTVHTPYRDADGNPAQSTAADVASAQAQRYWDYTDGQYSAWWSKTPEGSVTDLQYFGNCSDHASITGATGANGTERLKLGEGIPSVYIFWGDDIGDGRNDVTEQNYHVEGDIYEWPGYEDQFTVVDDDHVYTGNFSIERAKILATVFALSVYNTAAAPVEGIEDGGTYNGEAEITVAYNYRDNVKLDGEAAKLGDDGTLTIPGDDAEHKIEVTDIFGDTATYTINVTSGYAVTAAESKNGSVTLSADTAKPGDTVTITPKPDARFVLDKITVTDSEGNEIKTTENNGVYSFTAPGASVTVSAVFKAASFPDVASDIYYADPVDWAANNGIVGGYPDGTFLPDNAVTRAEFITILWRYEGSPAPKSDKTPFTDLVPGMFYEKAVQWGYEEGIIKGVTPTTFEPNSNVTRAQAVTILYRFAGSPDVTASNTFTDVPSDIYFADAVAWGVANGIVKGVTSTTFEPNADTTRGQAVTFLYRYDALVAASPAEIIKAA